MKSRYDFMIDSSVRDDVSGNFFPDVLSLNYFNLANPENYKVLYNLSDKDIQYFWERVSSYYESPEFDDMVLMINNIPHINLLKREENLILPSKEDIMKAYNKKDSV